MTQDLETATIAGGCFWCVEAVFEHVHGVHALESGYIGGSLPHPSYERVCDGDTGHAEALRLRFDAAVLPYRALLEIFFGTHDPTTRNRQGADVGSQYRSAIFAHNLAQVDSARTLITDLEREGVFGQPIVSDVTLIDPSTPEGVWYPAEGYHQGYYRAHPNQGYCAAVIAPKVAKFRQRYAHRLRDVR